MMSGNLISTSETSLDPNTLTTTFCYCVLRFKYIGNDPNGLYGNATLFEATVTDTLTGEITTISTDILTNISTTSIEDQSGNVLSSIVNGSNIEDLNITTSISGF
jgi:hypothetical protein